MIGALVVYVALVLGSAGLVVSGLSTVRSGFDRYAERTVVADRPRSSLDSIAYGTTAVVGRGWPVDEARRVPFGGRERALVYDVTVDDTNTGAPSHVDERIAPPFVLAPSAGGGTGDVRVRVDASSLRLELSTDRQWSREVASHDPIPEDCAAFADEHDLPNQGLSRDREFAYQYLAPGDELFVYGRAVPDEDRETTAEKAVLLTAREDGSGFVSDKAPETLLEESRRVRLKRVSVGATKAVVGLVAFLWLTGIAQFVLGA